MAGYSWISFTINLTKLQWQSWIRLGECVSKCEHLKSVPLKPHVRDLLHQIYLAKGVHATTAIEGNTLTEQQIQDLISDKLKLPPSKQYLEQEAKNIIEACNEIAGDITKGNFSDITVDKIGRYNAQVLANNVPHDEAAIPGEIRTHNVIVGNRYRAPDAKEVPLLIEKFCKWMNGPDFVNETMPLHFAIIKSIISHLYLAWIHPFGDGNGRVARLLEFAILLNSGVPSPAAHLLSNHYNMTRLNITINWIRPAKPGMPKIFCHTRFRVFLMVLSSIFNVYSCMFLMFAGGTIYLRNLLLTKVLKQSKGGEIWRLKFPRKTIILKRTASYYL